VTRPVLEPSADHPITVEPTPSRVRVTVGDQVIADTTDALTLQESTYAAVQYVPLSDVDRSALVRSNTTTYCPFKGDASYYSIVTPAGEFEDAIWEYQEPYPAVAGIRGRVAFYPDRVQIHID